MRFKPWLNVLGFGTRTDNAEANGLVVLELVMFDLYC